MIKLNRQPSPKDLFWFGLLLPVFVAILGAILRWQWGLITAGWVAWIGGGLLAGLFAAVPPLRRKIYVGWMMAVFPIGWLVSHVVLGMVFYMVLTPIGLLMRLVGYDPLRRRFDRQAKSYWIKRPTEIDSSRYFRQF